MDFEFLSKKFPAQDRTDGSKLYRSLGSFWTQIFQDKDVLKGYTIGVAEELIQSYYQLIDTLAGYSVDDVPVLAKKKWQPLIIRKSKLNKTPFVFEKNSAVFGAQPALDSFYHGKTFTFGFPKTTNSGSYSYTPDFELRKFSVIADRVISPTMLLTNGVDVIIDEYNTLFFNADPFSGTDIPRALVIGNDGLPYRYTNELGVEVDDEFIVLWVYHAEVDEKNIYENFGRLFELNMESSQGYKDIIRGIFGIFVNGPTVNAVKAILAAFNGVPVVTHKKEIVEDIYQDGLHKYVVTDKSVYRFEVYQNVLPSVIVGSYVYAGDILIDVIQYFDVVTEPNWWKTKIAGDKLALSSHIFVGNYKHQLFFSTKTELANISNDGVVHFPVTGTDDDVAEFHRYINSPENVSGVKAALRLKNPGNTAVINPVEFIFDNFIKSNTSLIKFNFNSPEELSAFFGVLPFIQEYLPPHVYLLFYINLNITAEVYSGLNSLYTIPGYPNVRLSIDGSKSDGMRPDISGDSINYYKDYKNRLFAISKSPSIGATGTVQTSTLNGTNQFFAIPNNSTTVPSGSFTFAGWFKANSGTDGIISLIGGGNFNNYFIRTRYNNLRIDLYDGASGSSFQQASTPVGSVTPGNWYFFAGGFNSSTRIGFISLNNGTVVSTPQLSASSIYYDPAAPGSFTIGSAFSGSAQGWPGTISSIGYWNTVLTASQITTLYNNGTGLTLPAAQAEGLGANLVSWWELNEKADSSIYYDTAPYVSGVSGGNHLTAYNGPSINSTRTTKITLPLHSSSNLDQFTLTNTQRTAGIPRAFDGKVFTSIPVTEPPPTNASVSTVLLIDFS